MRKLLVGGGNSNILYFHPFLGKIPNLTNIFQVGWNHPPGNWCSWCFVFIFLLVCFNISFDWWVMFVFFSRWNVVVVFLKNQPRYWSFANKSCWRSMAATYLVNQPSQRSSVPLAASIFLTRHQHGSTLNQSNWTLYPPRNLTWHLKIGNPKRKLIFQPSLFRGYVKFRGCKCYSLGIKLIPKGPKFIVTFSHLFLCP